MIRHTISLLLLFWLTGASTALLRTKSEGNPQSLQASSLEAKLDRRVDQFYTAGRPLIAVLLDFAYAQELPMGIEYVDRAALINSTDTFATSEPIGTWHLDRRSSAGSRLSRKSQGGDCGRLRP